MGISAEHRSDFAAFHRGHGNVSIWVKKSRLGRKFPNKQTNVYIIKPHVNLIISHVDIIYLAGDRGLSPYVSFIRSINNLILKNIHMQRISKLSHTLYWQHITIDERSVIRVTYGWGWWQAQCPWWQSATWLSAHVQSAAVVHWPACLLQWHKIIW